MAQTTQRFQVSGDQGDQGLTSRKHVAVPAQLGGGGSSVFALLQALWQHRELIPPGQREALTLGFAGHDRSIAFIDGLCRQLVFLLEPALFGALACELLIDAKAQSFSMPPQLGEHHQRGCWKHLTQLLCFPPGGVHHDEIGVQSLLL